MQELYSIDNVKPVEDGVYEVIRQLDVQLGDILG
jgi:hypothetical protein